MPIEIRELVIKASVTPAQGDARLPAAVLAQLRQELVRECTERVLEQLALSDRR
jgi:hypothetical protein